MAVHKKQHTHYASFATDEHTYSQRRLAADPVRGTLPARLLQGEILRSPAVPHTFSFMRRHTPHLGQLTQAVMLLPHTLIKGKGGGRVCGAYLREGCSAL